VYGRPFDKAKKLIKLTNFNILVQKCGDLIVKYPTALEEALVITIRGF